MKKLTLNEYYSLIYGKMREILPKFAFHSTIQLKLDVVQPY